MRTLDGDEVTISESTDRIKICFYDDDSELDINEWKIELSREQAEDLSETLLRWSETPRRHNVTLQFSELDDEGLVQLAAAVGHTTARGMSPSYSKLWDLVSDADLGEEYDVAYDNFGGSL